MSNLSLSSQLLDIKLILEKSEIEEGTKVADLGCGSNGFFLFALGDRVGKEGVVYGVDVLKKVLGAIEKRINQENRKNIKTIWSDLEVFNGTKIESGSLDTVLLVNTLHLSSKRVEIIREAMRMLKKDARLVVVEWKNMELPFGPQSGNRVKAELLKIGAEKLGLKLEDEFSAGQYHYGLIFSKL